MAGDARHTDEQVLRVTALRGRVSGFSTDNEAGEQRWPGRPAGLLSYAPSYRRHVDD
jgi:hypothetical protein